MKDYATNSSRREGIIRRVSSIRDALLLVFSLRDASASEFGVSCPLRRLPNFPSPIPRPPTIPEENRADLRFPRLSIIIEIRVSSGVKREIYVMRATFATATPVFCFNISSLNRDCIVDRSLSRPQPNPSRS